MGMGQNKGAPQAGQTSGRGAGRLATSRSNALALFSGALATRRPRLDGSGLRRDRAFACGTVVPSSDARDFNSSFHDAKGCFAHAWTCCGGHSPHLRTLMRAITC